MFGAIIINGYFSNESILNQTGRLIEEFDKLGIKTELLKSNEVVSFLPENKFYEIKNGTLIPLKNYDFIVYLTKTAIRPKISKGRVTGFLTRRRL